MTSGQIIERRLEAITVAHGLSVDAAREVADHDPFFELVRALEPIYTECIRLLRDLKADCVRRPNRVFETDGAANDVHGNPNQVTVIFEEAMSKIDEELDAMIAIKGALRRMRVIAERTSVPTNRSSFDELMLASLIDAYQMSVISEPTLQRASQQLRQRSH